MIVANSPKEDLKNSTTLKLCHLIFNSIHVNLNICYAKGIVLDRTIETVFCVLLYPRSKIEFFKKTWSIDFSLTMVVLHHLLLNDIIKSRSLP